MLDTGCTKTCFREGEKFLEGVQTIQNNSQILCANSETMTSSGSVNLQLEFSHKLKPTINALVIKNLSAPIIVGMDIISDLTLTKNSKYIFVNSHKLQLCPDLQDTRVCYTTNRLNLPPKSETFVKIRNPFAPNENQNVAIDCLRKQKFHDAITVSPSLNKNSDLVSVLITNSSNKAQNLPRRTPICTIEIVEVNSCSGVREMSDDLHESRSVKDFQARRLEKANKNAFSPKIGSVGDIQQEHKEELRDLVDRFRLAFSMGQDDIGKLGYFRFTLPLLDESETAYQPPRPIPVHLKEKVNSEIQNWLDLGIIAETQSGFNIPLIILKKPDGSIRVSLDARQLNTVLKPDRFPLPHLSDTLHDIGARLSRGKSCYVSTFDFSRGYWQVQVDSSDQHKLAFSHRQKHYCANRMLYGTSTAPSCFSRIMNRLFGNHPSFLLYLDDLIIIDNNYEDHMQSLEFLFRTCIKYGLLLSANKCHLAESTIQFLGHNIDSSGIKPLQKHIDAIDKFPRPKTKHELKRFLGMVNFDLRFLQKGSETLKPLYDISSTKKDFRWTDKQEKAFKTIKEKLKNAKGLRHRNPDLDLVLVSDASLFGMGATLYQVDGDEMQVIGYFSRAFTPQDQKRSMRAKELLALSHAIRHFEYFLLNIEFTCVSDHKSLLFLYREHMKTALDLKLTNIFIYLQQFNFKIIYSPGTSSIMESADCLSRLPKFSLDELSKKCEDNEIPDRIFSMIHTPQTEIDPKMKIYLRALAKGNESQEPIPDDTNYGPTVLKFEDYNFNQKTMQERQRKCSTLANIYKKIELKSKKIQKKFQIIDGVLYNTTKKSKRLVLPKEIANEFIQYCHTSYGHAGGKQLMRILNKIVYVPDLEMECYNVTRLCVDCLRIKPNKMIRPSMIEKRSFEAIPWSKTSIDLWDIGKNDRRGKRYLLTAVDHLTGFLECRALRNKTQSQTSEAMLSIILQHGLTGTVISDNGREFSSDFTDVLDKFKLVHVHTSAYMSMSNAKVERTHRELNQKLKLLDIKRTTWSEHFEYVKFLLNNLPKSNLDGLSAAEALYGRSLYVPFELVEPIENTREPYVQALNRYLTELHPSLMAFQYNKYAKLLAKDTTKTPLLKVNDFALIWKPEITDGKLAKNWSGPFRVAKRLSKHSYVLVDDDTKRSYRRNIRHLRPLAQPPTHPHKESDSNQTTNQKETQENQNDYVDEFEDNCKHFAALPQYFK